MKHMLQKVIKRFPPFLSPGLRPFAVFFLCTALFLGAQGAWAGYWIYTWTGASTEKWTDRGNWTAVDENGKPVILPTGNTGPNTNGDVVIIPEVASNRYPVIDGISVNLLSGSSSSPFGGARVTIENGATLTITSTITSNGNLNCGTITNNGTLINNGTLTSKSQSNIGSIGNIINNGTFTSTGTVEVTGTDAASGTITGSGKYIISGSVTTTSTQSYEGTVTVDKDVSIKNSSSTSTITFGNKVTLNKGLTVETSNGAITFNNTLNGAGNLTLSAGTGNIRFADTVGDATHVGAVKIQTAADITVDKAFWATSFTQINGSGTTVFNDKLTTTSPVSLEGVAFTFSKGVSSEAAFKVTNSGLLKISGGIITAKGGFTQNGTGVVRLGSDVSALSGSIDFTAPVTLTADISLTVQGSGNITFETSSAINSDSAAPRRSLSFFVENGPVKLLADVGDTAPLQNITLSGSGSVVLRGIKIAGNWENNKTTGQTTVTSIDFIGIDDSTISGTNIFTNFTCTTAGKTLLFAPGSTQTITNLTILGMSDREIKLHSKTDGAQFTINPFTTNVRYADIKDSKNIGTGKDAYDSNGDVASANNSDWIFTSTGTVKWVGGNSDWNIPGNWSSSRTPTKTDKVIIPVTPNNPILTGTVTVADITVSTGATINGLGTLIVNGDAIIHGNLSLASFTVIGATDLAASVTTTGAQKYTGAVTLGAVTLGAVTMLKSTSNGAISFLSTIDGGFSLTLDTSGSQTFDGAVGNTAPLTTLSTGSGSTTLKGEKVITTEGQTYNGAISLGADTMLKSTNDGAISFSSTIDGGSSLTLNTDGSQTFDGAIGNTTPLTTLSTGKGSTTLKGGTVKTTGDQTYNGAVTLNMSTSFSALAGNLQFKKKFSTGSFVHTLTATDISFDSPDNSATGEIKAVLSGNWSGSITVSEIEFMGSGTSTINGENTFTKFICKTAGKTIQFPTATATTNIGKFDVGGTQTNSVKLNGTVGNWNLHFTGITGTFAAPNMEFVTINNGNLINGNNVYAKNSSGTGTTNITGKKPYWIFANTGLKTWTGALSTTWSADGNWTGGTPIPGDEVLIPSNLSKYPILDNNSGILKKITIESSATVNVGSFTLTAENAYVSGSLSNITQISGSGTFEVTNLVLDTNDITIAAKLSVSGTTDIETTGNVSLDNTDNTFEGVITAEANDFILKSTLRTSLGKITAIGEVIITSDNLEITDNISTGTRFEVIEKSTPGGSGGSVSIGADIEVTGVGGEIHFKPVTKSYRATEITTKGGTVQFHNNVILGDDLLISTGTNAGNIIFDSVITNTAEQSLVITTGIGDITFNGAVGTDTNPLASLTVTNGTVSTAGIIAIKGGNIWTSGAQTYSGTVTIGTNNAVLSTTNGNITFNSTIDGTQNLTLNARAGDVTFNGAVGTTANLETTGENIFINGGSVTTTGTQSYTGAVTIGVTPISTLTTTLTTTNSKVTFNKAVNLNQNLKIDTGMGNGNIVFSGIAATINGTYNLEFLAGTGDITFDSAVGSENDPIGKFTVTSTGTVSFNNAFFQTTTNDFIVTSGNIAVGANTFIAGNIKLDSGTFTQTGNNVANTHSVGNISLATGTSMKWAVTTIIDDGGSLTITGNVINAETATLDFGFKSIVFASAITLGNLTLLDMTIASTGHVTLNGPITVRRNVTIDNGGQYTPQTYKLTLGGIETVSGEIKDKNDGTTNPKQNFGEVKIEQNNTTKKFTTDITAGTITCNAGSGAVTFEKKLTAIQLTNTDGTFGLFFNGGVDISAPSITQINTSGQVTFREINHFKHGLSIVNAPVNLGLLLRTESGNITFTKAVTLSNVSEVTIVADSGTITFTDTIAGIDPDAPSTLFLNTGTGGINFNAAVKNLNALNIDSNGPVTQTLTAEISAIQLLLQGKGTYTLDQATNKINKLFIDTFDDTDGAITFNNTQDLEVTGITRENNVNVTLTSGNLTFTTNPVNVTGANSKLIIDKSTGNGHIKFNTAVTVTGASSQISLNTGNGNIEFNSPLKAEELVFTAGAYSVALNNTGAHKSTITKQVNFNTTGIVTLNTSSGDELVLDNGLIFSENPSKILIAGLIDSHSSLDFSSPVETQSGTVQIYSNDTNIVFRSTIDNDTDTNKDNLVIESGMGTITFEKAVGGVRSLESVNVQGSDIYINGSKVETAGRQYYVGDIFIDGNECELLVGSDITFTDTITLKKNLSISTAASNTSVTFPKAIIGTTAHTETLTVNAGTGNVIFGGAVGAEVTPLKSVTITANTAPINPDPTNTDPSGGVQIASDMNAADFVITTPSNVFISGASTFNIGGAGNTINFPANLFIAAGDGNTVSFNKAITAANSAALFSGDVSLGGNLTTTSGDIVLLNGNSQTMFKGGTFEGLYGYNAQNMTSYEAARGSLTAPVSIPVFPHKLPNGIDIDHTKYSGAVSILAGKTLSAGQNFYANGVNLTAAAPWTLKLKDNNSARNAFAEAYNLTITNCTVESLSPGGYAWLSAAENCIDGTGNTSTANTGCAFSRPQLLVNIDTKPTGESLSGTYTIYDDVIRVEFVDSSSVPGTLVPTLIENTNNEISAALANIKFHNNTIAFTGSYTNPECTTSTNGADDLSVFYLKTNGTIDQRWNTDATGANEGTADSTDRGRDGQPPEHRTITPSIDIPAALTDFYQTLRDEHKNRIATVSFTQTADRCRPVVVEVRTGQEVHKPFATQEKYDAHNFIEIRYSEPVAIPQFSDPSLTEYVKSQDAFSPAAAGGAIKQNGTGLDISGFANLETGTVDTGTGGTKDNTVHALYRNFSFDGTSPDSAQTHRVRISIAGWTDTKDATGYEYPGYIDNAVTPSGAVTVVANRNIKDLSAATTDGNPLEPTNDVHPDDDIGYGLNRDTNHPKAAITVNETVTPEPVQVLYSSWDVAPPVVSRFDWNDEKNGYEIIGNSNEAGYVGNFEFHFFDNTPDYQNTPLGEKTWQYTRGWGNSSDTPIRPDTVGGSRPEYVKNPTLPQTQGGLRATTITKEIVNKAFLLDLPRDNEFDGNFGRFITLNNFFGDGTEPFSVTDDTLYLSLAPKFSNLRPRETYDVIYDSSKGYITDLAGNRLKSAIWRTVDRTPPKISMTVTPYDDTRLFVFFNKKIELEPLPSVQNATLSNIHREFLFFNKSSSSVSAPDADLNQNLAISDLRATKAELVFQTEDSTGLILTLSRKVNYTELSTAFISLKKHTDLQDITGKVTASNITDKKYNWMNWNDRIPITYFGVNTIKPLYATDGMVQTGGDKKEGTTVVIRGDFDGSGQLYYDREISMQVRLADGVMPQTVPDVFIDAKPNPDSVSVTFNKNSGKNLSFWLPNLPDFPYQLISPSMNNHAVKLATGTGSGQVYTFKIPVNSPEREPGDTLQFIFRHGEIMTPDRITGQLIVPTPFYHIRLNNAQDPSELSLFAFNVLSMLRQRGGSTILNNVIQAGSEEAVLEVIMPKQGNLTVSVMTLDGNVIKHLHHGTASAGTHYLRWNGTNASGRAVARGMYFVRIIGPNIDETRKIMVVKD